MHKKVVTLANDIAEETPPHCHSYCYIGGVTEEKDGRDGGFKDNR